MILIPAGEFTMGSNERHPDEGPEHKVTLPGYYIDKFEVTNSDYRLFVKATGHRTPDHWPAGKVPSGREKHPVVFVDWYDTGAYCKWAEKKLPTQEEWEKAARGTDARRFPWGNEFDPQKADTPQTGIGDTVPVGSFPAGASPYGVMDMAGNVWEWTTDYYLPYPGNKSPSSNYGKRDRVLKGGSWFDCLFYGCGISAPSYNRLFLHPKSRDDSYGFRCVYVPTGEKR